MWWIPPSLRQWTPRKCPWPSPRTAVKTIPTIPHLKQSVQSLVLKRTASATEILFSQILMVILQDLILLMAFRLQKFKGRKKEDGVLHVLFDCDIKNLFKACCDMTRYYLSHFFHVHVLSEWTNLMQAFFLSFFVFICTFCNIFGTLTKCAEICCNRTYLILLYAFKVVYSKISLVNHTDICFIFPDSMIIYMFL